MFGESYVDKIRHYQDVLYTLNCIITECNDKLNEALEDVYRNFPNDAQYL